MTRAGAMNAIPFHQLARAIALLTAVIAGLAGLTGCAGPLGELAHLDARAIPPDRVLLLGKIHIQWPPEMTITSTWLRAGPGSLEYPLPESEQVAWLIPRPSGTVRMWLIEARERWLHPPPDMQPVLMTPDATGSIVYFGTVVIQFAEGSWAARRPSTLSSMRLRTVDEADETLREFVELNPTLAGQPYFHLLRRAVRTAPSWTPPQ